MHRRCTSCHRQWYKKPAKRYVFTSFTLCTSLRSALCTHCVSILFSFHLYGQSETVVHFVHSTIFHIAYPIRQGEPKKEEVAILLLFLCILRATSKIYIMHRRCTSCHRQWYKKPAKRYVFTSFTLCTSLRSALCTHCVSILTRTCFL